MVDELKFNPPDTESAPPTLVSEPFLLSQEQVEDVVEDFEKASEEHQQHLDAGNKLNVGGQTVSIGFEPETVDQEQRWWSVTIKKMPDRPPELPERLYDILAEKEPLQDFSDPEEQWPVPSVE